MVVAGEMGVVLVAVGEKISRVQKISVKAAAAWY
jgi:hypothetical protein